ncbi:hypothetical protein [Lacticaseibacillus kribbianus]|uniref:hypothetical protein n=1 Tax=Lacticaseibacillus kribbianus TaxID=2926292 RepID=UPI001CD2981E|nr:hypothetical protein [Lacticaseibacillus kribbianus]
MKSKLLATVLATAGLALAAAPAGGALAGRKEVQGTLQAEQAEMLTVVFAAGDTVEAELTTRQSSTDPNRYEATFRADQTLRVLSNFVTPLFHVTATPSELATPWGLGVMMRTGEKNGGTLYPNGLTLMKLGVSNQFSDFGFTFESASMTYTGKDATAPIAGKYRATVDYQVISQPRDPA